MVTRASIYKKKSFQICVLDNDQPKGRNFSQKQATENVQDSCNAISPNHFSSMQLD